MYTSANKYSYKIYTREVWFCTETVKILHTQLNFNKKSTQITDINAVLMFLLSKNSRHLRTFSV